MGKIKDWIQKLMEGLPGTAPEAAMKYIIWYALFLALCAGLYLIMLMADWYSTGRPNLSEMRQFISTMLSGAAVAAIGFIARWLVDENGDGIPDAAAQKGGDRR